MSTKNASIDRLRILSVNIRSLSRHYQELLLLLSNDRNSDIDIIALSETWIKEEHVKLFPINEYRSFIQPRKDGRRAGGVILYLKEHLKIRTVEKQNLITANTIKLELQIHDTVNNKDATVTILLILYKDCKTSKKKFTEELRDIVSAAEGGNIVIIGDMNIDILDPKEAMEYLNMLQAQGFSVEHRIPTRDHSCLDHVMVRSNCIQTKVRVDEIPRITAHC